MPPKKNNQEQIQNLPPFKPITVLPIFQLTLKKYQQIYYGLSKQLSFQKNITFQKILQILKQRSLYIQPKKDPKDNKKQQPQKKSFNQRITEYEKILKQIGLQNISKNFNNIISDLIIQIRRQKKDKLENKDVAPIKKQAKKQAKKGDKKQVKVQQVVIQQPKIVQKSYPMDCDGFIFLLDFPRNPTQIQKILQSDVNIDLILVISQKIMWNKKQPNFQLLNQPSKSIQQLYLMMQKTDRNTNKNIIQKQQKQDKEFMNKGKQMVQIFKKIRNNNLSNNILKNICVKNISFEINPYKTNEPFSIFSDKLFTLLGQFSIDKKNYEQWLKKTQKCAMIKPIQIKQKRQVIVEQRKQDKKQGKKQVKNAKKQKLEQKPQIIQQIRQIRYQDQVENIKSNLVEYKKISKISGVDSINVILKNMVKAINNEKLNGQKKKQVQSHQIKSIFKDLNIIKNQHKKIKDHLTFQISSSLQIPFNFHYQILQQNIQFKHLQSLTNIPSSTLFHYYILHSFSKLIQSKLNYRSWNFLNRNYIEKYSPTQLKHIINQQLQQQPQYLALQLPNQQIKLILLYHQNPPGRIIYHNQYFDWKSIPNLQNWIQYFKTNQKFINTTKFFDTDSNILGLLVNKNKIMMPTDNAIIKQQKDIISSKSIIRHQIIKQTSTFGIKSRNGLCQFWGLIDNDLNIQVKNTSFNKFESYDQNGQANYKSSEKKSIWIRNSNINFQFSPYPIFYINSNTEIKRYIGSKGQIVRYLKDKSIWIGFPNGNISIYKGGSWTRIQNNILLKKGQHPQELKSSFKYQGQFRIQIRQDQTVLITSPNIIQIIFKDQSRIHTNLKTHTKTITSKNLPTVRIRLQPHKMIDQNVIGYGSAYAFLGFDNLMQRSYDGFIFQVFAQQFNYYLYHQKVNMQNSKKQSQISLIWFKQGSVLKVSNDDQLIYIANEDYQRLQKVNEIEPWLQLFTLKQVRKQGVYDIDLKNGCIQTTDEQGNNFKINLTRQSEVKIAVSFNINNLNEVEQPKVHNGYKVVEENYFLPTPKNLIDPKLFVIHQNGQGYQYFNQQQLQNYFNKAKIRNLNISQTPINQQQTIVQVADTHRLQNSFNIQRFVPKLEVAQQIPRVLNQYPLSLLKLKDEEPQRISYRVFIKQNKEKKIQQFTNVLNIYNQKTQQDKKRRNEDYKILSRQQFL